MKILGGLLIASVLLVGCVARTPDTSAGEPPSTPPAGLTTPEAPSSSTPEATLAASELSQQLHGRPAFSSVAIDAPGTGLILYWHGPTPSTELATLASAYPDVTVDVRATDYLPGELHDLATELLRSEESSGVGAVSVRPDGSGLDVYVHEDRTAEPSDAMAVRLSASTGVPVTVAPGAPVPAM